MVLCGTTVYRYLIHRPLRHRFSRSLFDAPETQASAIPDAPIVYSNLIHMHQNDTQFDDFVSQTSYRLHMKARRFLYMVGSIAISSDSARCMNCSSA